MWSPLWFVLVVCAVVEAAQPNNVVFVDLPLATTTVKTPVGCGGTIISDSKPRLRYISGTAHLEQSITFKHTKDEMLCFQMEHKDPSRRLKTDLVTIKVEKDVHRRHTKASSRRAAEAVSTVGFYRDPDTTDAQRHIVMNHLGAQRGELVFGVSLRRENLYFRRDWCTFYYWWNAQREHIHLVELGGPTISELTFKVHKGGKASTMTLSTRGQRHDPGHLGVKHMSVKLVDDPLQAFSHYVVPSNVPTIAITPDDTYNRTVSVFHGDRSVNRPDEFDATKAFFIDDPYQYKPYATNTSWVGEIISVSEHLPREQPFPRRVTNLALDYATGANSGWMGDPYPQFQTFLGNNVADSRVSHLAAAPSGLRYDLDTGVLYTRNIKTPLMLKTTFSLSEPVTATETLLGALSALDCTMLHIDTWIRNDSFIRCNASHSAWLAEGPLQVNLYTDDGLSLWQHTVYVPSALPRKTLIFDAPVHVVGNVAVVHMCSLHGVCATLHDIGRSKDMQMVHTNKAVASTNVGDLHASSPSNGVGSAIAEFWGRVKTFFSNVWSWVESHWQWVVIGVSMLSILILLVLSRHILACGGKKRRK